MAVAGGEGWQPAGSRLPLLSRWALPTVRAEMGHRETLRSASLTLCACLSVLSWAALHPVAWPGMLWRGAGQLPAGSQSQGGGTPALEIVTAAATRGNKTWKACFHPLCHDGSGSPGCRVLAFCSSR